MTRAERAKQFLAFDAMKGLREALKEKEEKHLRVEKRELTEETVKEISKMLARVQKHDRVEITCYRAYHEVTVIGEVTKIDYALKFISLGDDKIFFEDIYEIKILVE
ncbi:MAG: YolD-like family protein [Clostridiales bacterium]|nr:YolD-like family protein [Clostridiales bacterium]